MSTDSDAGRPAPPSLFPGLPRGAAADRPGPRRRPSKTSKTKRAPRRRTRSRAPALPLGERPPEPKAAPKQSQLRRRVLVGAGLIVAWGALILGQLVETQVFQHETMARRANGQYQHELTIPPLRGRIHDRRGRPLALTIAAPSVYAAPPDYPAPGIPEAARRLAGCLGVASELVERRLRRDSRFSWLKRRALPEEVACARETGLPVGVIEENGRFYPARELAAHLVGHTGMDGGGLGGIEHALDSVIRGEPGRRTVWTDGRRTGRASRVIREPRPGADVELTIDTRIQAIAEEELARGLEETGADSGTVILTEAATGEILALASAPSFDPNRVRETPPERLGNRSLTNPAEPGSVLKIFTAAAALNEGVTHEEEEFETFGGRYPVGRHIVRDWQPLGPLTFAGVIQRSSNIGTLQVASRLGSRTLGGYLEAFGFGERTGLPLGAESRGILPPSGVWRPIRLATVSFGQGIAVTPVQLARAVNAIANDGVRIPLRLVRRVGGEPAPFGAGRRVVTRRTAARVRAILAGAVSAGTGAEASVRGFVIGGKTGTAQKPARGGYSATDYIASFAGFAPAPAPLFSGVVILDVRKPNHSGTHAARVFGRVAERVLRRYQQHGSEGVRVAAAEDPDGAGFRPASEVASRPPPGSVRLEPASFVAEFFRPPLPLRDRIALALKRGGSLRDPATNSGAAARVASESTAREAAPPDRAVQDTAPRLPRSRAAPEGTTSDPRDPSIP